MLQTSNYAEKSSRIEPKNCYSRYLSFIWLNFRVLGCVDFKKNTKKLEIAEHHDACHAVFYLVISKVSPGLSHHPAKFEVNRCNGLVAIAKNKFLQHTMTDATSCHHRCHITSNLP